MRGTCVTCPVTRGEGDNVISFNFSQELERSYQIHEPDAVFNERVVKLNRYVMDFLRRLVLYSILWHQDKVHGPRNHLPELIQSLITHYTIL